jgi:hypothetical protein
LALSVGMTERLGVIEREGRGRVPVKVGGRGSEGVLVCTIVFDRPTIEINR